jgi:hypothetical protein
MWGPVSGLRCTSRRPPEPKFDWASIRGHFPDRRRWVLRVILADNRFIAGRITELRRAPLGESVYGVRPLYGWVRNNWKGRPDCYLYLSDAKAALEAATRDAIKANTPAPTVRPSPPENNQPSDAGLRWFVSGELHRLITDALTGEDLVDLKTVSRLIELGRRVRNFRASPPK